MWQQEMNCSQIMDPLTVSIWLGDVPISRKDLNCICNMYFKHESLGGDAEMVQVHNLSAVLSLIVCQHHHKKAIWMIDQCVNLFHEQCIGSEFFTIPQFHFGYQVALMALKYYKLALVYLVQ